MNLLIEIYFFVDFILLMVMEYSILSGFVYVVFVIIVKVVYWKCINCLIFLKSGILNYNLNWLDRRRIFYENGLLFVGRVIYMNFIFRLNI